MSETTLPQNVWRVRRFPLWKAGFLSAAREYLCVCLGSGCGADRVNHLRAKTSQRNYSPSPSFFYTPPPTAPLSKPQTFHDTLPPSLSLTLSAPPPALLFFCSNVDSRRKLEVFPQSPARCDSAPTSYRSHIVTNR